MEAMHEAVMTEEVIDALKPKAGGRYLDGTLGGATHTKALLDACGPDGRVLSMDLDATALERASSSLSPYGDRWIGVQANFRRLRETAQTHGMAPLDGIVLDLGLSSDLLANPKKGLSFQTDGPLDMRFGPDANEDGLTAAEIVNSWPEADLERMIREYGEEPRSRQIAMGIVLARKQARIIGTFDLVSVIKKAVHAPRRSRIHPATRTFQALRIAVNHELENLQAAIAAAASVLKPGGRLAIISFHSLEDRIVKRAFRSEPWESITKRPMIPGKEEIERNPRSRSAKLRVAELVT
jgi:16S rRNA (cytosine1402-N4)-methyltransferase